jgi:hypothetical protein
MQGGTMTQSSATDQITTASLVRGFSDKFNAEYTTRHAVTSPLGLWMLLALLAPSTTGRDRSALEDVLGTKAHDAAARADMLLTRPHPAVASILHEAVWTQQPGSSVGITSWAQRLPSAVEHGPVPPVPVADRWLVTRTGGSIDHFPAPLDRETAVVLASALHVRVQWADPFRELIPSRLGGEFGAHAHTVLASGPTHDSFVTHTRAAGAVGVHAAWSIDGLFVLSVLADVDVPPNRVHAAATEVTAAMLDGTLDRVDPFDLPLGPGHGWNVSQDVAQLPFAPSDKDRSFRSVLAPWTATSDSDLHEVPGIPDHLDGPFGPTGNVPRPRPGDSGSTAGGEHRLSAIGAASAVYFKPQPLRGVPPAPMRPLRGGTERLTKVTRRRMTLLFNRPHAVLGVARSVVRDGRTIDGMTDLRVPEWDGVPVFSAWVDHPAE